MTGKLGTGGRRLISGNVLFCKLDNPALEQTACEGSVMLVLYILIDQCLLSVGVILNIDYL
jgi:hypothetical protein